MDSSPSGDEPPPPPWLASRLEAVRREAIATGAAIPVRLPAGAPLLNVPRALVKILDRDLAAAAIAKRDERKRTVDDHALRHTFGTHPSSKGGDAPRTAQAAMRHSTIDLTMNVYPDPRLLDVMTALDVIPSLPLESGGPQAMSATGTDGRFAGDISSLVPTLVPTS